MAGNEDKKDPERPKRIADKARDFAKYLQERKHYHAQKSQSYGYSQEVFNDIASSVQSSPDDPLFIGLEHSIDKFKKFVKERENEESSDFDVSSASFALGTAVSATTSVIGEIELGPVFKTQNWPVPPNGWTPERHEQYARRLENLEPELAKLSRSVWQTFYGGVVNGERAALFSMRQLYDHFFQIISPDDKVRDSSYFAKKEGDNKNQVHRRERIRYAANMVVNDRELGSALEAQTDHLINLYGKLNSLHTRGALDRNEAKNILSSMQAILEEWIDALKL